MKTKKERKTIPIVPVDLPKRVVQYAKNDLPETHSLRNGNYLEIGDVFYRIEKHVILKTVKTEGSEDIEVESRIMKSSWQKEL